MTYPDHHSSHEGQPGDGTPWTPEFSDEQLDQLLGEDADPNLSVEAKRAIVMRIRAEEDAALDRLLDLDGVAIPSGLAARVMGALDSSMAAQAKADSRDLLVPAIPRRRRLYLVGGAIAAAAAAAVLAVVLKKGSSSDLGSGGGAPAPHVADADLAPSDEFLALLPALENVDFLIDELDPLEADALFLFETEDDLLLDLLDENG